ncbi:TetR/AcrR family transcriptional regulator [Draconibacterium sp.]|nr:TetR/AcrR family transcriptional regulator [Draconibacterium sp.]
MISSSTNKVTKQDWLESGYQHFATFGPDHLSIKRLSKELEASRGSFYNYFGDVDIFVDELLTMHWKIAVNFNNEGKQYCTQLFPDLYDALAKYPIPLQFNMQLFRHRHIPAYNFLFIKTYEDSAKAFLLKLFAQEFNLSQPESELFNLWLTVGEAWYSRLNPDDLSSNTLQMHAREILDAVIQFSGSTLYSSMSARNAI